MLMNSEPTHNDTLREDTCIIDYNWQLTIVVQAQVLTMPIDEHHVFS